MKLYHFKSPNFGDALNTWLWPRLLPGVLDDDPSVLFVGIGTLLNDVLPREPFKAIFGSGVGYGKGLPVVDDRWRVYCVRGPLSADALGIEPELAVTDSAALVRALDLSAEPKRYPISFMPHFYSASFWEWDAICSEVGLHYIDPLSPVELVLAELRRSEMVVAEAMHGAIVADALRVPWVPVRAYAHTLDFKWRDWTRSLGMDYAPVDMPALRSEGYVVARPRRALQRWNAERHPVSRLLLRSAERTVGRVYRRLSAPRVDDAVRALKRAAETTPILSTDETLSSVTARLEERLDAFRSDYAAGRLEAAALVRGARR